MTDTATTYSYINMILLSVIGGSFFLLCTVMGYWAAWVNRQMRDVCTAANDMAKEVHGLKQWRETHDKQDDERHGDLHRNLSGLSRDMNHVMVDLRRKYVRDEADDERERRDRSRRGS